VTTIQRTFVSTSGSDANPCTAAQPCRNFAAAIANTTAGGEVVALTSGGYGPFTVNKAITIAGAPGAHVALTAFAGTGITVNADSADAVVLRNLYLTGLGGVSGIFFQNGGSLHVESVVATGFSGTGLFANAAGATLVIRDSVFRHDGNRGVDVNGSLRVEIADSRADGNGVGFALGGGARGSIVRTAATGNTNTGFHFDAAVVAVSDSVADGNDVGAALVDGLAEATLTGVTLSNNIDVGLFVEFGVARIAGTTVTGNSFGLFKNDEGTLETFGDNLVRGNATQTLGSLTAVGKT
jgi:hypothetical protein